MKLLTYDLKNCFKKIFFVNILIHQHNFSKLTKLKKNILIFLKNYLKPSKLSS